jgi:NADPH-dependent curcumin reductase CurA
VEGIEDLENSSKAFIALFNGENFGKTLVKLVLTRNSVKHQIT